MITQVTFGCLPICVLCILLLQEEIRSSLVWSMLRQMLTGDRSEEVREAAAKSLGLVLTFMEDVDKYEQVSKPADRLPHKKAKVRALHHVFTTICVACGYSHLPCIRRLQFLDQRRNIVVHFDSCVTGSKENYNLGHNCWHISPLPHSMSVNAQVQSQFVSWPPEWRINIEPGEGGGWKIVFGIVERLYDVYDWGILNWWTVSACVVKHWLVK